VKARGRVARGGWRWIAGLAGALIVVGPGLAPGSLLNLDLVLTPTLPLPPGVWGLGPGLPRSLPYAMPVGWISSVLGGPVTGKLVIVASLTLAFVGAARLVDLGGVATQAGAGALYSLSPFMLTRVGVGHLTIVLAAGILPFALPVLLRPAQSVGSTFLWCAALGFTGFIGGVFAAAVLLVGLIADRGQRMLQVIGVFVVAQLPWIVPGIFVSAEGVHLASASNFATDAHDPGDYLRVLAGFGFWDPGQQVSRRLGATAAAFGLVLVVLAIAGTAELPVVWGRRAAVLAVIGFVVSLGSRAPGARELYDIVVDTTIGGAIRESQRLLPLYLVWMAPAAALGARKTARALTPAMASMCVALPLAIACVLAGPGLFGLNKRLEPASFPSEWGRAHERRDHAYGTLLALPFSEYVDLHFAGNRRVLNPIPPYFGGDVIYSSDPELDAPAQERADPREPTTRRIVSAMGDGRSPSPALARIGVRWVALLHEEDWLELADVLDADPGIRHVVRGASLDLYQVTAWKGPAVAMRGGAEISVDTPVLPLADFGTEAAATWYRGGSGGWLRGFDALHTQADGTLAVPAGGGLIWYWPAVVVLAADLLFVTSLTLVLLSRRRARHGLQSREGQADP
jgi:hypothetical protein